MLLPKNATLDVDDFCKITENCPVSRALGAPHIGTAQTLTRVGQRQARWKLG